MIWICNKRCLSRELKKNLFAYLSTEIQQRCNMLAVEKYTSKLFQRSHKNRPNSHRPESSTLALNVIAHRATGGDVVMYIERSMRCNVMAKIEKFFC